MDVKYNYWNSSKGPFNASNNLEGARALGNVTFEPYTEECASISIEKYTNGVDDDTGFGPTIEIGTNVT